ncbi:MAG TPA: MFS transporter [Chthoniobacterales bacterium]|nr:MFS transporter [Chthoniobacterales bacterium]
MHQQAQNARNGNVSPNGPTTTVIPLRILVPLIVACALFMENLDATVLSTALPAIARDLHQSPIQLKLALTSYLMTLAIFIPASGWFADRFGTRIIFRLAILIFAVGSALCGFANSIGELVAARALQGIGGAMMVPVGRLVILRTIPRSEFVGALAWLTMPALIGPVLGPPVGGFITTYFHWRWIFWINLPVAALGIILATLFIPNVREETVHKFDFSGFFLSGIGLGGLVSASAALDAFGIPLWIAVVLFLVGSVAVCLYVVHARYAEAPILDLRLLRIPTFRSGIVGGSFFRIGVGAMPLLLPLMLQLGFGMTPLHSGLLTFVTAVGAFGMKTVAGPILKRFGFWNVLVVNSIISAILIAAPAIFTETTPPSLMLTILFVGGFFRSLQFTCINAISVAEIEQADMSQATSFTSAFQQIALSLGVTVGASMLQLVLTLRHGQTLIASDFGPAFLVVGVIGAISFVSFARLPKDAGAEVAGRKVAGSAAVAVANGRSRAGG